MAQNEAISSSIFLFHLFPKFFLDWINIYLWINNSKREKRELDLIYYHGRILVYGCRLKLFLWLRKSVGIGNEGVKVSQPNFTVLCSHWNWKNFCSFSSTYFLIYIYLVLFSNITGYLLWVFKIQTLQCQTIYQVLSRFLLKGIIGISLLKRIF